MSNVVTQSVNVRSDPFGGYSKLPYRPNNGVPTNIRRTPYTHPGAAEGEPGAMPALPVTQTARPGKQSNDTVQYARVMPQTGSIYNRLYDEMTKTSIVFCHKDGITNYAGNSHRLSVLRGIGWLNDEMRKSDMGIDPVDVATHLQFVFQTRPVSGSSAPRSDAQAYTDKNYTNNMAGRDASIGLNTICDMLTDVNKFNQLRSDPTNLESPPKYAAITDFLRCWRLDGVVLTEDIDALKEDRLGSNHLLFNIVVGGMTNVRNVNVSRHNVGTNGVAGGVARVESTLKARSLPQEFDPEPLCGDEFYVALHLNPIQGPAGVKFHFEWRLWSAQRWNTIADRVMIRSGVLTTRPPPGGDEDGSGGALAGPSSKNVVTRASMAADKLLEEQLFTTIVGGYRLGTVVDTHAAVMARQDGLGGFGTPHQRCAAVRMSINIQWHGLLELRQRHGTNCAFANDSDEGRPVVLSSVLSKEGLGCYPIDIGEAYSALGRVFNLANPDKQTRRRVRRIYQNTTSTVRTQLLDAELSMEPYRDSFESKKQVAETLQTQIVENTLRLLTNIDNLGIVKTLLGSPAINAYIQGKIVMNPNEILLIERLMNTDIPTLKSQIDQPLTDWINEVTSFYEFLGELTAQVVDQKTRFRQSNSFYAFFTDVADCRDDADNLPRLQSLLVRANDLLLNSGRSAELDKTLSTGADLLKNLNAIQLQISPLFPLLGKMWSQISASLQQPKDTLALQQADKQALQLLLDPDQVMDQNLKQLMSVFANVFRGREVFAPRPALTDQSSSVDTAKQSTNTSADANAPIVPIVDGFPVSGNATQALDAALNAASQRLAASPSKRATAPPAPPMSSTTTTMVSTEPIAAASALDQLLDANPSTRPTTNQAMPPPPAPSSSRKKRATASDTLEDFVRSTMEDMSSESRRTPVAARGAETVASSNSGSSASSGSSGSSRNNSRRGTPQRQRGTGTSSSNVSSNADDDEFFDDDEGAGVFVPPPSRGNKRIQRPQ